MSFGRGGRSFGGRDSGRGGGRDGGRGGFAGRGRGRGDEGPPAEICELGIFLHGAEGEMVCRLTNAMIPYFNAGIYLQNKSKIGKVEEVFGPVNKVYFTVKPDTGVNATSFQADDKVFIGTDKLLPLSRFLNEGKSSGAGRGSGRGGGRGGSGGRSGGRSFSPGGRSGGRGFSPGGRSGAGGFSRGGFSRGGGRGGTFGGRGRG